MREIGVPTLPRVERRQTSSRVINDNQREGTESPVKDRVCKDIGAGKQLQNWALINWKRVLKRVRNLRQRIYRATQNAQWNQVRSLMKLMLRSYSTCCYQCDASPRKQVSTRWHKCQTRLPLATGAIVNS
jgi:RNA-directed DNA polymerase